jgi:hypothetical protein
MRDLQPRILIAKEGEIVTCEGRADPQSVILCHQWIMLCTYRGRVLFTLALERKGSAGGRKGSVEGRKGSVEGRKGSAGGRKGSAGGRKGSAGGRKGSIASKYSLILALSPNDDAPSRCAIGSIVVTLPGRLGSLI